MIRKWKIKKWQPIEIAPEKDLGRDTAQNNKIVYFAALRQMSRLMQRKKEESEDSPQ